MTTIITGNEPHVEVRYAQHIIDKRFLVEAEEPIIETIRDYYKVPKDAVLDRQEDGILGTTLRWMWYEITI